jgi:PAAR motif
MQDMAVPCNGLIFSHGPNAIAEGAQTVRINNLLAARVTSKLTCGAEITKGESTVVIGGPTERVLEVDDFEETLQTGLKSLLYGSLVAVFILTIPFGSAAVAELLAVGGLFIGGFEILGAIGDEIGPGWRDILQGAVGLGAVVVGGARGRARMRGGPSSAHPGGELPPGSKIIEEGPSYKVYETADGQQRIRFKADEAVTKQSANSGRTYTVDTRAGLNNEGKPFVYEGRHRAIGAAKGDTIPPDNGGVPDAPGYLDYEYEPTKTSETGVPVRDLSIDYTEPDVPASEAKKIRNQRDL